MAANFIPPVPAGTVSLVETKQTPRDEDTVRTVVEKADYALAESSPGKQELAESVWSGLDDRIRKQASLADAVARRNDYIKESSQIVANAGAEGRALTDEEKKIVLARPLIEEDPLALEARYADRLVDEADPEPEAYKEVADEERSIVLKQEIAHRVLRDALVKQKETGWGGFLVDVAKGMIPGYSWFKQTDRIEGLQTESVFTGQNKSEQFRSLYLLPASEFEQRLSEAVNQLASENIVEAVSFASDAVEYSSGVKVFDNAMFGLDVTDIATLGVGAAVGAASSASRAAKARVLRDTRIVNSDPKATNVDRLVVSGKFSEAAEEAVLKKLESVDYAQTATGQPLKGLPSQSKDLFKDYPSLLDPDSYLRNVGTLTNEKQRRITESLAENREVLRTSLTDVSSVARIDDEAAEIGFRKAEQEFRSTYFRLEDGIIDVTPIRESNEVFGGVDRISVTIGKKDASAFDSAKQANYYATKVYRLPDEGYEVAQKGNSFFLRVDKTIDETDLDVLDARINTTSKAPETMANLYLGWLRNPDDVRSLDASSWAKVATYGGSAVMNRMTEVGKKIGKLGKNEGRRLSTIIDSARFEKRTVIDPSTGEKVSVTGRFYEDVGELERAYTKKGLSTPSEKEIEAYFSFRQLMDYDFIVRNVSVYRDKARLGINQKSVGWIHVKDGKKIYKQSPFFEGKTIDKLPSRGQSSYTIAWYDGETGKTRFNVSDKMFRKDWDTVDDLISKGYRILQIADPSDAKVRSFVDSMGEPVQYMLVRDMKEKPLSGNQVAWNEGGHWIYPQKGLYVKQPRTHKTGMGRRVYDGDVTAFHFDSSEEAARVTDAMNKARIMLRDKVEGLSEFLADNLPYSKKEFSMMFGKNGAFDIDTPFGMTSEGQTARSVVDLSKSFDESIVDLGSSEHNLLSKINTQYTQERGERLTTVRNTGTEANPIFKTDFAPLMDPLEAVARSSSQLSKSRFFDDYKHRVVENYVTQFHEVMDVPAATFRADPMRYIREPQWVRPDGTNAKKVAAAKNSRRALLHLLAEDSQEMATIKWARQKTVDTIYKRVGGDSTILDSWRWNSTTDPSTIARGAVFHLKLGLLNVVQLPLQAQAVIHAAAVDGSPVRAARANFLYWGMRMRGLATSNPRAQGMFGKALSKALGIPQSTVDEMYDVFRRTGMDVLEGEYARLDDYLNPKEFFGSGSVSRGLDAGTFFFKEGNMTHRGVSFATSFLRWREANPLKKIDNKAIKEIVDRADLYYVNMSRASNNAILNQGAMSIPAQFTTYHKNLMEQMLGKRLTVAEKARVVGVYSAVYGVPIGAGVVAAPLWPVHESVRQAALESGADVNNDLTTKFIMNGAVQVATELLTGEDFNFAQRYGPGGLGWLRDLLDGDTFDVVSGASGSTFMSAYERATPFGRALVSVFTPDKDDYYQLTSADFVEAAREISSVNNAVRAYYAVTASQFMNRSGDRIMNYDADMVDAVLIGALGLTPQAVSDMYLKLRSIKSETEMKAAIGREVKVLFNRATKASADGDVKLAETLYKNARTLVVGTNYTPLERASLFRSVTGDNQQLLEKIDRDFMTRDPQKRRDTYLNRQGN